MYPRGGLGSRLQIRCTQAVTPSPFPPIPGLNVYSMLKHHTLVLTLPSVAFLEDKLLWQDSRYTPLYPFRLPYSDFP